MNRREFLRNSGLLIAGLTVSPIARALDLDRLPQDDQGRRYAEGVVHEKGDRRKGVAGICVSNGREVVKTDGAGKWRLPVTEDTMLFVIKPSGWKTPVDANNLPCYYFVHKPQGSPDRKYAGVAPTGALPASVDFALERQKEDAKFRMVLFGDPQPRDQKEIDYMAHDVIEQATRDAKEVDAKFGLSLGDEMFNNLEFYDSLNGVIGTIGLPWYNVVGNHDLNQDAPDNTTATETFQRVYGPTYYAFDYAKVHFIVLDNVFWDGAEKKTYHGEITARQLEFVRNDLVHVPNDHLVVVAMHIPLTDTDNREALYRLLENRPHTFSLSAHTHVQQHAFIGVEEGWKGTRPHHHLNHATVCGSWWEGAPDERGIPHATMSDGGPNGYSILEFDGAKYKVTFRPASKPQSEQMALFMPESIGVGETLKVVVNVFAGSERSKVEMRVGEGAWRSLAMTPGQDPYYLALKELENSPKPPLGRKLPVPTTTPHLWTGEMPALTAGTHSVHVRTTDMFGQVYEAVRILRVKA